MSDREGIRTIKGDNMPQTASEHRKLVHWMKANGVDPSEVPIDSAIEIENDRIYFLQYLRDAQGELIWTDNYGDKRPADDINSVPLIIPWED